jgi:CheY-like chemotaxis protein
MPRILLVDDDQNFVEIAQALLEAGGHQVTPAEDGEQALAALENTEFDLMITDIIMPKIEGIELIRKAKAGYPDLCIMAISARDKHSPIHLENAKNFGADDVMAKPIDPAGFMQAVAGLVD